MSNCVDIIISNMTYMFVKTTFNKVSLHTIRTLNKQELLLD